MRQRSIDLERSDPKGNGHDSDDHSIRLRSSRRNELLHQKPLDLARQKLFQQIYECSASLDKEDGTPLLSKLSSIRVEIKNLDDDDEIVKKILQINIIDKLLEIVSSHDDVAILIAVYSILARLTYASVKVVSIKMAPDFLAKSLSLISPANATLTLNVAVADDDYCEFEVKSDVTVPLLQYLHACQPTSVGRNEKSCCGTFKLEESLEQPISKSLLLLATLIKVSFPDTLKHDVMKTCVPYFLSSNKHVQLMALNCARHFVSKSEIEYFLQFPLPNNQMKPNDTIEIPVLVYLVNLLGEKRLDFDDNVKAWQVFRQKYAKLRPRLEPPEGMTQAVSSYSRTIDGGIISVLQNCLKTIGTVLAIFGQLVYLSEEREQIVRITEICRLGELLDWSIAVTKEKTTPPSTPNKGGSEDFQPPPLIYQSIIQQFMQDDTENDTLLRNYILGLNKTESYLLDNVLFLLGNALGKAAVHTELVLSSLFLASIRVGLVESAAARMEPSNASEQCRSKLSGGIIQADSLQK
ncbi:hypothetical protein BLNAU_13177 [Blattamonas nauphoetae]|uniref:Uncharacterized protein n=1 Tax=Blattamonas nauphoetae TaxID=2049346 RepID=A0ABQ9XMA0_9EUKA|nr:hypothetical protein BLNAU_13177 [Blattamonas nauphoetae]